MLLSSRGTTTKKAMKRVPWAVLEGPWRTSSSSKLNRALLRLIHLSSPSSHTETCSINKKCLFTWYWCPEQAWEHWTEIEKDSRNPQATLFTQPRMRNPFTPNGVQTGKMLSFASAKSQMLMTTIVFCALKSISKEKKNGYSVWDCVGRGITNSAFSVSSLFILFLLVYRSFLIKWFFFVGRK